MRFNFRTLLPTVCAAAVVTTGSAFAAPITLGTISATVANFSNSSVENAGSPVGPTIETFNVNNINFTSTSGANGGAYYTLGSFFTSLGATVTNPVYFNGASGSTSLANTETTFTGSFTTATTGTFSIMHDDGIELFLNGSSTDYFGGSQAAPTVASSAQPGATVGAGMTTFRLVYAENGFAPAELEAAFTPAAVTPEPSSIMLLGSGLVGLAGLVRRRFKA